MSSSNVPQIDPDAEQVLVDAGRVVHTRDRLDQALIEAMTYEGRGFPVLPRGHITYPFRVDNSVASCIFGLLDD